MTEKDWLLRRMKELIDEAHQKGYYFIFRREAASMEKYLYKDPVFTYSDAQNCNIDIEYLGK